MEVVRKTSAAPATVASSSPFVVQLLAASANKEALNQNGKTALDVAREQGHDGVVVVFAVHAARAAAAVRALQDYNVGATR